MHIGFITSHFPFRDAKSVGGIGTSIKNLSDELIKLNHQVTVFVYGQENDIQFIDEGILICKIQNLKFKGLSWYLTRKKIQNTIDQIHKENKIDIVEAADWEGITSFINLNCPIVIRENGSDAYFCYLDKRKVKFWNKFQEKRALEKATAIIAVSQFTGELTNEIFGLNRKFTVIPNGIDTDKFKPSETNSKEKIILYFGGIIRKKGLFEIPHYFNLVHNYCPDAKLILVGKDMSDKITGNASTFRMIETLFSEKAVKNVQYLGSIPYQEIKNHIAKATICIFPSFAEALPVSWIEAMAMEKALITSNIGWSNEIIDDGINGFKVHPKEHKLFAHRIYELLDNEELRKKIEKKARQKILSHFSSKIVAEKSVAFYNQIITNR
jgi:glycosyltransferase involved in cell wall biosynthesis